MDATQLLPLEVLVFGAVVLGIEAYRMTQGFGPQNIRIVGLTLVIIISAFLVVVVAALKASAEVSAAAFGLLGAIAGYLFGRDKP